MAGQAVLIEQLADGRLIETGRWGRGRRHRSWLRGGLGLGGRWRGRLR